MISQLGMQKRNGEQARFEYTEILIPSGYDTDIPSHEKAKKRDPYIYLSSDPKSFSAPRPVFNRRGIPETWGSFQRV
jgi:hypothetical protein